ncbi:MAG: hypothetical protein V3U48_10225 [Rhodospirillales bacterium]
MIHRLNSLFPVRPLAVAGLALFVAALLSFPAGAAALGNGLAGPGARPLLLPVKIKANRCVRLLPTGGREVIVNNCSTCRVVNVTRKRPGNAVPVMRSFNVLPKTTFPVPFRGPGRSRVTSVLPCKGQAGAARNLVDEMPKKKTAGICVSLERVKTGGVALVNKCGACKAALIERQNQSGGNGRRQAYQMKPLSVMEVPSLGAARIGLVGEINCP